MVLKKCPSCKNVVSMDSYCCPRCGINFSARRMRILFLWLAILALGAWMMHERIMQWWQAV